MKRLIKKLGYGYSITYNNYSKKFAVYKLGEWHFGTEILPESRVVVNRNPKKAIKKYIKKFKKV
jgi:hypothetical protein